jgi:hypothetical protein
LIVYLNGKHDLFAAQIYKSNDEVPVSRAQLERAGERGKRKPGRAVTTTSINKSKTKQRHAIVSNSLSMTPRKQRVGSPTKIK